MTDDGEQLSATIRKTYFDKQANEWVETDFFLPHELCKISSLLQQAIQFCVNTQSKQ